ncbi:ATP-binding protein [Pedococcus sp. 5OH_020]|uniref:ATP-binding protein n=1 Tax=Pedococcus sp. 5OH_020 TaxID=2989814 RepID=UPI0022E9BE8A|nr:ATP-binding protein [Pedococcus sp. 5OH_020]
MSAPWAPRQGGSGRCVRPGVPRRREKDPRPARFPARKSLEEFDFDDARGLKRDLIAHLGTLDFAGRHNVVFLGPPRTGKTHLATGSLG